MGFHLYNKYSYSKLSEQIKILNLTNAKLYLASNKIIKIHKKLHI